MAFTFSLTFDWLRHRMLAATRILRRLPIDYFMEKYKKSALNLSLVKNKDNLPCLCPICGFAMAELILAQGWSIRACSAKGFAKILENQGFDRWRSDTCNSSILTLADPNSGVDQCQ